MNRKDDDFFILSFSSCCHIFIYKKLGASQVQSLCSGRHFVIEGFYYSGVGKDLGLFLGIESLMRVGKSGGSGRAKD